MFKTFRRAFAEFFMDVDDGFSAKRLGFYIFTALIVTCVLATVFWKLAVPSMIWTGLVDLVKWIGAAILGERAPAVAAAFRKPADAPAKVAD